VGIARGEFSEQTVRKIVGTERAAPRFSAGEF
jgi:hypothetical protein